MSIDCIFCKIIAGKIPTVKVFENQSILAILDINPVNPGHVLVIPKNHVAKLEEASDADLAEAIKGVKIVGAALKKALDYRGYNVTVNNDPIAGQLIPHLHFHVIPRLVSDGLHLWPQKQYQNKQEMDQLAEKIKMAL